MPKELRNYYIHFTETVTYSHTHRVEATSKEEAYKIFCEDLENGSVYLSDGEYIAGECDHSIHDVEKGDLIKVIEERGKTFLSNQGTKINV